jgi:acylphosphatase
MRRTIVCVLGLLCAATAWPADALPKVVVDAKAGTVTLDAQVAEPQHQDVLKGAVEYLLVAQGGKAYESLFVTGCTPAEIKEALEKIGLKPGKPADKDKAPEGPAVRIFVETGEGDKVERKPADAYLVYLKTGKRVEPADWTYTGSREAFNPETDRNEPEAFVTKHIVGLHRTDASPLIQNPRDEAKDENLYAADRKALGEPGTDVRIIFEKVAAKAAGAMRRVHVFVSGRVQGVGFRNFTEGEARRLGLTGWVTNLPDGRVEAVIEGPSGKIDQLLEKLNRGPRAAKVDKLEKTEEKHTGEFKEFDVRY